MSKTLNFSYKGKDYTLEYTKRTVKEMEGNGFNISDIDRKQMTTITDLFSGAFLAHHRWEKADVIEEIYAKLPDKKGLIEKLAEMYNEPLSYLVEDPEDAEGNVEWTANW